MPIVDDQEQWKRLLAWLTYHGMAIDDVLVEPRPRPGAGYGLFAIRAISPSVPLFNVPASALLNVPTLSWYNASSLSAVQLISLHLYLYRPSSAGQSSDPHFGPYISILPQNFNFHPLSWLMKQERGSVGPLEPDALLLAALPGSILRDLQELASRYRSDWKAVKQYLEDHPAVSPDKIGKSSPEDDYLWAWLNVNTRCIHYQVQTDRSHRDNIALCPILDFANHSPGPRCMSLPPANKFGSRKCQFTLLSPSGCNTEPGEELYLTYGAHANRTLFVEYGFVNQITKRALECSETKGDIDVHMYVERLFEERSGVGMWMRDRLTEEGYWGEWTLHSWPMPAYPSFRLITALRLYHMLPEDSLIVPLNVEQVIKPWQDVIRGKKDAVSEDNERAWRRTLLEICRKVSEDASRCLAKCRDIAHDSYAKESVKMLCEEQEYVGNAVAKSVEIGVEF